MVAAVHQLTGNQLYQQAVSIAQLVISVIQYLEHASKQQKPLQQ